MEDLVILGPQLFYIFLPDNAILLDRSKNKLCGFFSGCVVYDGAAVEL